MQHPTLQHISNLALLIILIGFCACAPVTFTPYYKDLEPKYDAVYDLKGPIVVAAQDQRPYVLDGDKTEFFYGITRSLYGIPYSQNGSVSTSNDVLNYIYLLLENPTSSFAVKRHEVPLKDDSTQVISSLTGQQPVIFVDIDEWKTDTPSLGTPSFMYDLTAYLYDSEGNLIMQKSTKGNVPVENPDPEKGSSRITGRWYQKVKGDALGEIFLDPQFIENVNAATSNGTVTTSKSEAPKKPKPRANVTKKSAKPSASKSISGSCSVEQILKMKEMDMTDSQIRAACK